MAHEEMRSRPQRPLDVRPSEAMLARAALEEMDREEARVLEYISEKYGAKAPREERLAYHNEMHTTAVTKRVLRILDVVEAALIVHGTRLSWRIPRNARLVAVRHDTEQDNYLEQRPEGTFRVMRRPKNEHKSAVDLERYAGEHDERHDGFFTREDIAECYRAILATIPEVKEDGTVHQPHINDERSLVVLSVALGDVAGIGMDDFGTCRTEWDRLFLEQRPDMANIILDPHASEANQARFRTAMSEHLTREIAFGRGRQQAFENDIQRFPGVAHTPLRGLFCKFDDNIASIPKEIESRNEMAFDELRERMRPAWALLAA